MSLMRFQRVAMALVIAFAAMLLFAADSPVSANDDDDEKDPVVIKIKDDCDPETFNAALGPGSCVGDGDTTFQELIEVLTNYPDRVLKRQNAVGWKFSPKETEMELGETLVAKNRGGEFHTFTEVAAFGGGCIDELNAFFGLGPVPECADPSILGTTGVAPSATLEVGQLEEGTYLFQCMIHPWQRATVEVEGEGDDEDNDD